MLFTKKAHRAAMLHNLLNKALNTYFELGTTSSDDDMVATQRAIINGLNQLASALGLPDQQRVLTARQQRKSLDYLAHKISLLTGRAHDAAINADDVTLKYYINFDEARFFVLKEYDKAGHKSHKHLPDWNSSELATSNDPSNAGLSIFKQATATDQSELGDGVLGMKFYDASAPTPA